MHGFVFSFPLDILLLRDRVDAKLYRWLLSGPKQRRKQPDYYQAFSGSSSEKDLYGPRTD